jgi:ketosteroid isomerase-like protein
MQQKNITLAEEFYTSMGQKNVAALEKYVHPDIQFTTPLAKLVGKKDYLEAVKKFVSLFNKLTIRAKCGSENQAIIVYDVDFPMPIGKLPSAALMTFRDGLITNIELFFDSHPFK